jgi:hypothetical protein
MPGSHFGSMAESAGSPSGQRDDMPANEDGLVVDQVVTKLRALLPEVALDEPLLPHLLVGGCQGWGPSRIARSMGISYETLRRRAQRAGLPPLGILLRWIRVKAVSERLRIGIGKAAAIRASGWWTVDAFATARYRARSDESGWNDLQE